MVNKGFLFVNSSRKIKNYVVESQIIFHVWSCSNHLQKNITQLITWLFLVIQSVNFTSAAFEAFAEICLCFLVSASKKNAEVIKFLGISQISLSPRIKFFSVQERKAMLRLIKKSLFFHTIFKLDFITQIIYCIIHRCLRSHFILFLFSYISL